jgi:wyosine [tRNA(Phe)-imidazoG37] synthetase (radical SAM superfamily)
VSKQAINAVSSVYGPVQSWRVGRSLGIDLLCVNSICSFRCVYCQLGRINVHTAARQVYVPTEQVWADLKGSAWATADIITLAGSGEPTLAANLGAVIREIKSLTGKPVLVLTNSAHLHDPQVRRDLRAADKVFCKLDAASEVVFRRLNRPVAGVTLGTVIGGISKLRGEYTGYLGIQLMLMSWNVQQLPEFARILRGLRPDEVQLNAPTRQLPRVWSSSARGNLPPQGERGIRLKQLDCQARAQFAARLRELTGLKIITNGATDAQDRLKSNADARPRDC